jgi:hypothetical protein
VSLTGNVAGIGVESISRERSPSPITELVCDLGLGVSTLWALAPHTPSNAFKCWEGAMISAGRKCSEEPWVAEGISKRAAV